MQTPPIIEDKGTEPKSTGLQSGLLPSTRNWGFYQNLKPNDYYFDVCADLWSYGEVVAPRREFGFGSNAIQSRTTKELHPTFAVIQDPRKRIITSMGRVLNIPFALAEVIQILSGENDAQALKYYNSRIMDFQGDDPNATRFNAAYGERLRSYDVGSPGVFTVDGNSLGTRVDQLEHIIHTLRKDPNSRQAQFVLWHPNLDNHTQETKDRACNVSGHVMIRHGKLDWLQIMRSNDIIFGLPYNFFQWGHVMEWVATHLDVPMGQYTLVQDSLHVYENQYDDIRTIEAFDMYDYFKPEEYFPMEESIQDVARWERRIRQFGPQALPRGKHEYWREVIEVFNAYAAFKRHADVDALTKWMPYTFELRWPLMRWMVNVRWGKHEEYSNLVDAVKEDLIRTGFPQEKVQPWLGLPR